MHRENGAVGPVFFCLKEEARQMWRTCDMLH